MAKRKIILLILLVCTVRVSNALGAENSSPLNYDLTGAKTISIGKIIEDKTGKRFFIAKKQWTRSPLKVELHDTITNRLTFIKVGNLVETHIFASVNETNSEGILNGPFEVTPVSFPKAKDAIDKLALSNNFVGEINPSWQFCESSNECTQAKNQCGKSIGVSKKYQNNYLDFLKSKKIKTECSKDLTTQTGKSTESKCVDNFCS